MVAFDRAFRRSAGTYTTTGGADDELEELDDWLATAALLRVMAPVRAVMFPVRAWCGGRWHSGRPWCGGRDGWLP